MNQKFKIVERHEVAEEAKVFYVTVGEFQGQEQSFSVRWHGAQHCSLRHTVGFVASPGRVYLKIELVETIRLKKLGNARVS